MCLCLIVVYCMMRGALCFVVFVCLCVVYTSVFVCVVCDVLCVVVWVVFCLLSVYACVCA